jgi:hypothetical protein
MSKLNAYEHFALNYFLTSYPENVCIQGIFNMMLEYSEEVVAWGDIFWSEEPADLIREIETMIILLEQSFVPREVK